MSSSDEMLPGKHTAASDLRVKVKQKASLTLEEKQEVRRMSAKLTLLGFVNRFQFLLCLIDSCGLRESERDKESNIKRHIQTEKIYRTIYIVVLNR